MITIKRDGTEVPYNKLKIVKAIEKAGATTDVAEDIAEIITRKFERENREHISVEDIQDRVEEALVHNNEAPIAKEYIRYRYKREIIRECDDVKQSILDIVNGKNEYVNTENSNKNPTIISTQRDYIAGEISKSIARTLLLPKEVVECHDKGVLHLHDMDYTVGSYTNCCLVNLEDMLQNGTVISNSKIDKPHRFLTACNIATQVVSQVASSQYGGQTFSLAHLAPFVNESRVRIKQQMEEIGLTGEQLDKAVNKLLKKEIEAGVQTVQYQINTLSHWGMVR